MRYLAISILLILMLSASVMAQSYYHEVTIQLDGDYEIKTHIKIPEADSSIDLKGAGKAFITSKLIITADKDDIKSWWNLF